MFMKMNFGKIFLMVILNIFFVKIGYALNSNDQLADKVENAINNHYRNEFEVTANHNNAVTIEGKVKTYYDKLRIFQIVSKVKGVRTIVDNVRVDAPILPDKEIQSNIVNELKRVSSILEPERIEVSVDNGEVILRGKVSFYREKLMAQTVASWEKGVKGITNNIIVLPPAKAVSDSNLKIILNGILYDQFPVEKNVFFTINNGIVDLNGSVNSLYAKKRIEDEFSSIIGIVEVNNNLTVKQFSS